MNKKILYIIVPLLLSFAFLGRGLPPYLSEPLEGVDALVVYKQKRILEVWYAHRLIRIYTISLGRNPIGPKRQEGDQKTPEGNYSIDWKHPNSAYYAALHISYPNVDDKLQIEQGVHSLGGDIMIHGMPNGLGFLYPILRHFDWTQGCIAISNVAMEELRYAVKRGTPITIKR